MKKVTELAKWSVLLVVLLLCGAPLEGEPPTRGMFQPAKGNQTAAADEGAAKSEPAKRGKAKQVRHKPNHLAKETSPYLLLHAHNPVDWYPWNEETLAKAKKENKIIFLSIGYSSCHWCHVMERESFMDEEIAAVLNKHFVCIKVDREERPDVDKIYMTALQVFNQLSRSGRGGGWPLSMFLTPAGQPFFGGTYFPARDGDRGVATGFMTLLTRVQEVWKRDPDSIRKDGATLTRFTKLDLEGGQLPGDLKIDKKLLAAAQEQLGAQYDPKYGGFGFNPAVAQRPKFPEPSNLLFLIDRVKKTGSEEAKAMLVGTLERMALGGIRDHLGGGFHRYSVDRFWRIPHFEKMLYDNGQLATVYTEAYLLTRREDFRRVLEEMLRFVLREMTSPEGGFYSALDAESEDVEGMFYRWEKAQVQKLLTADEFKLFASVYGLDAAPNFEEHYFAPQLSRPFAETADDRKQTEAELEQQLAPIRKKLFDARARRERPLTDTKILTSWNGLMIRGFADAGRGLKDESYVVAARRAARFVLEKLRTDNGRLLRTYGQGRAKLNAYLNDYAFFIDGLIALHRATGDGQWLAAADQLMQKQLELFWDSKSGGFFFTSDDHETLLARAKNPIDGAQPSGNSVSAQNLLFLADALGKPVYRERAKATIRSFGGLLERSPAAATRMLVAVSDLLDVGQDDPPSKDGP
ncbi:MAG: thioredoxin domain-containing protein [Pirellulales bacterium]